MPQVQRAQNEGATAAAIRVGVLGPTRVEVAGAQVPLGGKGQRALLLRLILAEGRMVTVDRLIADLWGEDAAESIVSTLHGYVSRLRSVLGGADRLQRQGPGYLLDVESDDVDARQFESLLIRGRALIDSDPRGAVTTFDQALALWRGPAFADVTDHDWAAVAATRLDGMRLEAAEARFDAMLAAGDHASAAVELELAVTENPLRERFTAQWMIALYRSGRQAEALRAFEGTRRILADELGLDPSPDLVRVEGAILGHEPWLAAPANRAVSAATPAGANGADQPSASGTSPVPLPPAALRHASRPFVGRAEAMAVMWDAWKASHGGRCQMVVIEGEAGAGKTRAAAKFAADAHADGAIVLWGRASTDAIVPYAPVVEALRTVLHEISAEALQRVATGRDGLALLLPFFGDLVPSSSTSRPELGTDRYVLFETVADLINTESAMWPIVLVLDDLQWIDPLSLRLIQHVINHERSARVLVVGTIRTVPATHNPDLDAFLGDLHRDAVLSRVPIGGLDENEIVDLLAASGGRVPASRANAIHRATRGNAFFVTELAEHGDGEHPPPSVRDVLGGRLSRLGEPATRLLHVAAVAGNVATVPVLTRATEMSTADLLDAVDEAIAAGLLVEEGSTGALAFRHAIVQQVVLERLNRVRRRSLHLALADATAAMGSDPLNHAHHLVEAGELAEPNRVVDAAVAAGYEANAMLAYEDGVAWAQRALNVAGAVEAPQRCSALLLLSDSRRALGDRLGARAAAGEAADVARTTRDPRWLARAAEAVALSRTGIGFDFGVSDQGLDELLVEALRELPDTEVDQRSRLLEASLSNAAANQDLLALRGLSAEALDLAGAHGHDALVATAHLAARMSVWRVDLLDQRLSSDRAAREAAERSGKVHLHLNALLYLVSDLVEAGQIEEAERWFGVLRDLAQRVRQPVYDAFVDFFDARTALMRGQYDEATRLADRALVRGLQSHGLNGEQAWAGIQFIRAWDLAQLPNVISVVEQAARSAPHLPVWRVALASCLTAAGRGEEARPIVADLVRLDGLQHAPDSLWYAAAGLLAEVTRDLEDKERAAVLLREMLPYSGRISVTGLGRASLGPVDRFIGVAAFVAGELDLADTHLQAAAEQARAMQAWPFVARAVHDRAVTLRGRARSDDAETAARLDDDAERLAAPIGLVLGRLSESVR